MTERDRAILRDRIARTRLQLATHPKHPPARSEGTVAKLEKRIRKHERTIADLRNRLDNADRCILQATRNADDAIVQRDRAITEMNEAREILEAVSNRRHLDAERLIVSLRRRIAELEAPQ